MPNSPSSDSFTPFVSSGASSRSHYVLVKNLESASSLYAADHIIVDQVRETIHNFADPNLSLRRCKEYLIILLYCYSNVSNPALLDIPLDNAISNAATLAEAGQTVADKRIGYRFCAEMMPKSHPLQLLLVNTLRKDLESAAVPRICLALDYLITSASEDVIPAIQSRLEDLLQHNSTHVRRRVLVAFQALSQYEPELLEKIVKVIIRRMSDRERSVSAASLAAAGTLYEISETSRPLIRRSLDELLHSTWGASQHGKKHECLVNILSVLQTIGASETEEFISLIAEIITVSAQRNDRVLLRAAFLTLPPFSVQESLPLKTFSPIRDVASLLTSHDLNDQYLFLTCLDSVSPLFWSGNSEGKPAVLKEWEVGQVMRLLDSPDSYVRKMTIKILNRVDGDIVDSYYAQSIQTLPPNLTISAKTEFANRLLEVLEIRTTEDGEHYARSVHNLLKRMDSAVTENKQHPVLEAVIETILNHIRQGEVHNYPVLTVLQYTPVPSGSPDFRLQCATTFLTYLSELDILLDPNQMVIMAALTCEYLGQVALSPPSLLRGLWSRLDPCPPAVQDACLLAMLRVAAECEDVSQDIVNGVSVLGQNSKRYIRRRCEQFVQLQSEKDKLAQIVQGAKSSSLPDFLESLQNIEADNHSSRSHSALSTPALEVAQLPRQASSKLRYAAYGTPSSVQSRSPSSRDLKLASAGEASTEAFEMALVSPLGRSSLKVDHKANEEQGTKNDLISFSLDSPFISDPSQSTAGPLIEESGDEDIDFNQIWQGLAQCDDARGWYNDSMEKVVRQLQMMDDMKVQVIESSLPPFVGELKIIVVPKKGTRENCAILRLREEEDNSCLWRFRAGSSRVHEVVKNVLSQ